MTELFDSIMMVVDIVLLIIMISSSIICTFLAVKRIYQGYKSFNLFTIILIFGFFVLPRIIYVVFPYEYTFFGQANEALKDHTSTMLYSIFITALNFCLIHKSKREVVTPPEYNEYNSYVVLIGTLLIYGTILYTLYKNGLRVIIGYGNAYFSEEYDIPDVFFGVSMMFYLFILGYKKFMGRFLFFFLTFGVFILAWINGKRSMIASIAIMAICIMALSNQIKSKKVPFYFAWGALGVLLFCIFYGVALKGNIASIRQYFAIDLSRDYTLIYQFYCDKIGRQITVGRFDAIIYIFLFWVPRSIWPGKPYPFSNSLTKSLLGMTVSTTKLSWSTTCSIFSDLYSSFSIIGLIIGIWLICYTSKKIDFAKTMPQKTFLVFLQIHLLTVQLSSALIAMTVSFVLLKMCELLYKGQKVRFTFKCSTRR